MIQQPMLAGVRLVSPTNLNAGNIEQVRIGTREGVDFAVEMFAFQIYAYARLMSPFRHEDGVGKARQVQTSSPDV